MKKVNGQDIIALFEKWSPKKFAMDGDPIGLHIGQLGRPVANVLVTLDVNQQVVEEAVEKGANLIIAHHPPLFRPLKNVLTDTSHGRIIETCIKNDISIYAAHTNLDVASGGVNDLLAEKLGLRDTKVMEETYRERLFKLVVFCPLTHSEEVRRSLKDAGAGELGEYEGCSFSSVGIGRFTPVNEASPFIGTTGTEEKVDEERVEVLLTHDTRDRAIQAMLSTHPYEEPAYEILRLEEPAKVFGLGRVGRLAESMTLDQFAEHVKNVFSVPALRFVGKPDKIIRKVAVLGGDGNKYIFAAKKSGADVLVTGDLYYHVAHDAEAIGLAVVDPGHNIEKVMIDGVSSYMRQACREMGFDVRFIESEICTEPFTFI